MSNETNMCGNSAKLREALVEARKVIKAMYWAKETLPIIDAALDAPPRNCDIVPNEAREAADMFHRERPCHGYCYETHDWLLAPATEQEGGNDAYK